MLYAIWIKFTGGGGGGGVGGEGGQLLFHSYFKKWLESLSAKTYLTISVRKLFPVKNQDFSFPRNKEFNVFK